MRGRRSCDFGLVYCANVANPREDVSVGHESVLRSGAGPALHVLALSKEADVSCSQETLGRFFPASGNLLGIQDVALFATLIEDRAQRPWWLNGPHADVSPSAMTRATYALSEGLRNVQTVPNLALAAVLSLVAAARGLPGADRRSRELWLAANSLGDNLTSDTSQLEFDAEQTRVLLRIAATMATSSSSTDAPLGRYGKYEIPFGLSPETKATPLEQLISGARMLALLPLAPGAVEATAALDHGQFLAAGEFAVAGAAVTVLLSAGVALAERALAWGQKGRN